MVKPFKVNNDKVIISFSAYEAKAYDISPKVFTTVSGLKKVTTNDFAEKEVVALRASVKYTERTGADKRSNLQPKKRNEECRKLYNTFPKRGSATTTKLGVFKLKPKQTSEVRSACG